MYDNGLYRRKTRHIPFVLSGADCSESDQAKKTRLSAK